jgi:Putative DNA-binding domain
VLSLAEFQRHMVADILGETAREGMEVHRDTVLGGLVNALRLTFPTVVKLTGEAFFDQVATEYARANPPRCAVLYFYGDGFPNQLCRSDGARALPYLGDVARFDLSLDRAAHQATAFHSEAISIDPHLEIRLAGSLCGLQVDYPVDLIRDALDAGRPDQLPALDMTPRTRHFAIWRGPDGASVKPISPAAAAFLDTLLKGGNAEAALQCASEFAAPADVIAAIQTELLSASFTRLTWHAEAGNPE